MKDIVAALKLLFVLALSLRSKNGTGSLFWGEEEEVTDVNRETKVETNEAKETLNSAGDSSNASNGVGASSSSSSSSGLGVIVCLEASSSGVGASSNGPVGASSNGPVGASSSGGIVASMSSSSYTSSSNTGSGEEKPTLSPRAEKREIRLAARKLHKQGRWYTWLRSGR